MLDSTDSESNSQQPGNQGPGGPLRNQFNLQETVAFFAFSRMATRLRSFLDSDSHTLECSQKGVVGLTLDNTQTSTTLRQLTLSIVDQGSQVEAALHSEPSEMAHGQGGSNDACS